MKSLKISKSKDVTLQFAVWTHSFRLKGYMKSFYQMSSKYI